MKQRKDPKLNATIKQIVGPEVSEAIEKGKSCTVDVYRWIMDCSEQQVEQIRELGEEISITAARPRVQDYLSAKTSTAHHLGQVTRARNPDDGELLDWDIILFSEADQIPWDHVVYPPRKELEEFEKPTRANMPPTPGLRENFCDRGKLIIDSMDLAS